MPRDRDLTETLAALPTDVFPSEEHDGLADMLGRHLRRRIQAANTSDAEAWATIGNRQDWEAFVRPRIDALRRSLGTFPEPAAPQPTVAGTIDGDGYRIENLRFDSRPDLPVAADLYLPEPLRERMPGVLLVHSHHNPMTQGELQDMGALWAPQGCMVLVMDQLAYGERRQHTPGPRQDYSFRYHSGVQLQLIGDNLMGWMVWDIQRCVDLLLARAGIDIDSIVVMGSVAGGGDLAVVAAALDDRITCAIPFNFGGPQPETQYPLPEEDAEQSFNYLDSGDWETTRCLACSGRDGFLPWAIVASLAPRHLIHAHEFSWDQARDPVWKRLQRVFGFYDAESRLGFSHGFGLLTGQPPQASHCNNVGPAHRKMIYPLLERWFGIGTPQIEVEERRDEAELRCFAADAPAPRPLHDLWADIGAERSAVLRDALSSLPPEDRRKRLRAAWSQRLGDIQPVGVPHVVRQDLEIIAEVRVERILLDVEPGVLVPMLLLRDTADPPVVVALSQGGKQWFLQSRAAQIADLLASGTAVCLPDLSGIGETTPDPSRPPNGEGTSIASTELMLGQTLLGARLRDLRSVLSYLRTRHDLKGRFALWGDSPTPPNLEGFPETLADPLGDEPMPAPSEPLGGLLSLFGALFEEDVCAVYARVMIAGYAAALRDRFCYLPYDVVVPGALAAGDLCDVVAALAPMPIRLEGLVDSRNCLLVEEQVAAIFASAANAYDDTPDRLTLVPEVAADPCAWLAGMLYSRRPQLSRYWILRSPRRPTISNTGDSCPPQCGEPGSSEDSTVTSARSNTSSRSRVPRPGPSGASNSPSTTRMFGSTTSAYQPPLP